MILGLNVRELCYYIKVIYIKPIHLKKKQCEHEFYIYVPRWKIPNGAATSFSLTPKNGHEKKQIMKIMSRMLLIYFILNLHSINVFNCSWQNVVKHLPTPMYFFITYIFCRHCKLQL